MPIFTAWQLLQWQQLCSKKMNPLCEKCDTFNVALVIVKLLKEMSVVSEEEY